MHCALQFLTPSPDATGSKDDVTLGLSGSSSMAKSAGRVATARGSDLGNDLVT